MILILSLSFCSQVFSLDGIVKGYGLDWIGITWMDWIYLDGLDLLGWIGYTWMDCNFGQMDSLIDAFGFDWNLTVED